MHHLHCNGQYQPVALVPNNLIMRSPSSTSFGSEARGEACSSRQTVAIAPDKRESFRLSPYSSLASSDRSKSVHDDVGTSRLRRRASQGSLRTKPSTVARFLSSSLICDTASKGHSPGDYSNLPPTPPDDDENVGWNPMSRMLLFDSYTNREPRPPSNTDEGPSMDGASRGADELSSPSDRMSNGPLSSDGSPGPSNDEMDCGQSLGSLLENATGAAVSSLPTATARGEAVKIVSQMLPYPRAADKLVKLPTQDSVFCSIVQTIQTRLQPGQSPYINITHAVPEQFSLSNLPSSPPSTPRLQPPSDDYFNSQIFCSAAAVSAYHDFRGPIQTQPSHSPMPIVPPFSVHVSVLERYLPPSSAQEHKDLFCHNRPSFLVDRLFELSPDGGSLLFIYPTKKGASTFKTQYLGPILDPLLRQLVVVNGISADVGRYLGKLSSVSQMDDFETMKANIAQLCRAMSCPSSQFTLVDAGKGSAYLDRNLWTEWYIHQEKTRMKEVLSMYWQNGRRLPASKSFSTVPMTNRVLADKEVTSSMLLSEILDGIKKRPYGEESEPRDGVEFGVFVIRRSH